WGHCALLATRARTDHVDKGLDGIGGILEQGLGQLVRCGVLHLRPRNTRVRAQAEKEQRKQPQNGSLQAPALLGATRFAKMASRMSSPRKSACSTMDCMMSCMWCCTLREWSALPHPGVNHAAREGTRRTWRMTTTTHLTLLKNSLKRSSTMSV